MTLPDAYTRAIAQQPSALHELLNRYANGLVADTHAVPDGDPAFATDWVNACAMSEFIAHTSVRYPAVVGELWHSGDLLRAYPAHHYQQTAQLRFAACKDEETLMRELRVWRRREMIRIAWRDLNLSAPLDETLGELSALADAAIDIALQHL
ncbi:MAG: hypothetical protein OEW08_13220, partial [Gammaproteobacteria bacterium]|nr:hypothetical protein [Gammaproteobacteria bacterium]